MEASQIWNAFPTRRGLGTRWRIVALRWGTAFGLIVLYELTARIFFPNSLIVPAPSEIIDNGLKVYADAEVRHSLLVTAQEFLIAFGLAAVVGVATGLLLASTRLTRTVGRDVFQVLFTVPQVTLFPLLILFVGLGNQAKIAFGVSHGIFPIVLSTIAGVSAVDRTLPQAIRAMGGGPWAVAWKAVLPSALPSLLIGLRIGASLTLLGVLLAELLASSGGIGATVVGLSAIFESDQLFALVAGICAAAVAVNWGLLVIQRRLTRWKA